MAKKKIQELLTRLAVHDSLGQFRYIVTDNGEIYFVGKDIAEILGYTNPQKAIRDHVDAKDKGVNDSFTLGQGSPPVLINESGLYSLIFGSQLASAKAFKRWVTSEVLPSIRKTGSYSVPSSRKKEIDADISAHLRQCDENSRRLFQSMKKRQQQLDEFFDPVFWAQQNSRATSD